MREILYRGKRKVNEEWAYGFPFVSRKGEYKIKWYDPRYGSAKTSEVHPNTVGQFTGLLDANGTKIFEGDIVKRSSVPMLVVWNEYGALFEVEYVMDGERYCNMLFGCEMLEVIGNIHDNPELLE